MKVLAVLTLKPAVSLSAVRAQLADELRGSWTLYSSGLSRRWSCDRSSIGPRYLHPEWRSDRCQSFFKARSSASTDPKPQSNAMSSRLRKLSPSSRFAISTRS